MAGSMQISGLASGLDSTTIVSQLMAAERRAGAGLLTSKTNTNSLISALQRLNTLTKDMSTAAAAMRPDVLAGSSPWQAVTTKVSDPAAANAVVAAGGAASPGSYTFTVKQVAAAATTIASNGFASTTTAVSSSDFSMTIARDVPVDGVANATITVAAGSTLQDVAKQINGAGAGVSAAVVTKSDGLSYLQLSSATSGAGSEFRLLDSSGAPASQFGAMQTVTAGRDTLVQVGDAGAPGAYEVKSSTTAVAGLIPGVTVNAVKASSSPVTVDVVKDVNAIADKMAKLVDAANAVMANVQVNAKYDSSQKYDASKNPLPPFVGDSTTRDLVNQVSNVFVGSASMLPSSIGVDLQRDGTVKFDRDRFLKALAADPAAVEKTATDLANKLDNVGKAATNAADGFLTVRIQGSQNLLQDYTQQIAKFEDRMTQRQATLERQFTALESMLSKLKQQSSWLTGQLASLSNSSK